MNTRLKFFLKLCPWFINKIIILSCLVCWFTNVPLEEAIGIEIKNLFGRKSKLSELINRSDFWELLKLTTKLSISMIHSYYKQLDVAAMGSPLGPALVNAFSSYLKRNWLKDCRIAYTLIFYKPFLGIFVLPNPEKKKHINTLLGYLNSKHPDNKITCKIEKFVVLLDISIPRSNSSFKTSAHHNSTFSGVYTSCRSFIAT